MNYSFYEQELNNLILLDYYTHYTSLFNQGLLKMLLQDGEEIRMV